MTTKSGTDILTVFDWTPEALVDWLENGQHHMEVPATDPPVGRRAVAYAPLSRR